MSADQVAECGCGRLRESSRPTCCNQCENGRHTVACCMRQVSLRQGSGQDVGRWAYTVK